MRRLADLLHGERFIALSADEHDIVADGAINAADIDHELIHADSAEDRGVLPADNDPADIRQAAGVAVRIADGDGGDDGGLHGGESQEF